MRETQGSVGLQAEKPVPAHQESGMLGPQRAEGHLAHPPASRQGSPSLSCRAPLHRPALSRNGPVSKLFMKNIDHFSSFSRLSVANCPWEMKSSCLPSFQARNLVNVLPSLRFIPLITALLRCNSQAASSSFKAHDGCAAITTIGFRTLSCSPKKPALLSSLPPPHASSCSVCSSIIEVF